MCVLFEPCRKEGGGGGGSYPKVVECGNLIGNDRRDGKRMKRLSDQDGLSRSVIEVPRNRAISWVVEGGKVPSKVGSIKHVRLRNPMNPNPQDRSPFQLVWLELKIWGFAGVQVESKLCPDSMECRNMIERPRHMTGCLAILSEALNQGHPQGYTLDTYCHRSVRGGQESNSERSSQAQTKTTSSSALELPLDY